MSLNSDIRSDMLRYCKQTVEDVYGWKILIFLPHNVAWRCLILLTVCVSFFSSTLHFFFNTSHNYLNLCDVVSDLLYFVDVLCATLHYCMTKTRNLRHGKRRSWYLLTVDYVSLIPMDLVQDFLMYSNTLEHSIYVRVLVLNACLRCYQIHVCYAYLKLAIYDAKVYFLLTFFESITYLLFISHFISCCGYITMTRIAKDTCDAAFLLCFCELEVTTYGLLSQTLIKPITEVPIGEYKLMITIEFIIGFVVTYGFMIPLLLFSGLRSLRAFFEFSYRCKQLNRLVHNFIEKKDLRDQTLSYLESIWVYGKGDKWPDILQQFPISLQKSVFTDIHWEAFRHSDFLRDIGQGCKRTLSMYMRTEFIQPNTILVNLKERKNVFMYLSAGLIQIMAEENSSSPVATFSEGTVLGESCLFLQTESKAILRTAKFSEIHMIKSRDLFRALSFYPKDFNIVKKKLKLRLKIARATLERKLSICPLFLQGDHISLKSSRGQPNIKWIKQQYRTLFEMTIGMAKEKSESGEKFLKGKAEAQLDHTSIYIYLLSVNDEIIKRYEAVCLKFRFPFVLNPQCAFLVLWRKVILILVLISSIVYPGYIGWVPYSPHSHMWFHDLSVFITFFYVIDIVLQLGTAVMIQKKMVTEFGRIFATKLLSAQFLLDLAAAIPLQLFISVKRENKSPYMLNLYYFNALIKVYRMILFLNNWNYSVKPGAMVRTIVKYLFLLHMVVYWLAAFFKLAGIECIFYDCHDIDWYNKFTKWLGGSMYRNYASVFLAIFVGLRVPGKLFSTGIFLSYVIYVVCFLLCRFGWLLWNVETVSAYVLEKSPETKYKKLMDFVRSFMVKNRTVTRIQKRIMDTMTFQWRYDYGDYLTEEDRIFDDLNSNLRDEIDRNSILQTLKHCMLFEWEEDDFYLDLCKKAHRLALPAKSVLFTFGTQTMSLYIIHKGFVQVNSFLPKDIHRNTGKPLVFSCGDSFPVMVVLCQVPATVSARTLTDCELIILDLEEVLSTMIVRNVFHDVVEALKATDTTALNLARLALSPVTNVFKYDEESYSIVYEKMGVLGRILKVFTLKRTFDSTSARYIQWECSVVLLNIISVYFWPWVSGVLYNYQSKSVVVKVLIVLDCIIWVDIYIRLHVAYYNKIGIIVTHPLSTSLHYLKTTFFVDFLTFVPDLHCILAFQMQPPKNVNFIIFWTILKAASLYRLFGLASYLTEKRRFVQHFHLLKYCIIIILIMNLYFNYMVNFYATNDARPQIYLKLGRRFLNHRPVKQYLYEVGAALAVMTRLPIELKKYDFTNIVYLVFFGLMGWLLQVYLFAFLTLHSTTANHNFTIYQHYMKSFVKYLNKEKVDDGITSAAIKHFEHEWDKQRGENLKRVFSRFPNILHEDLMFPLYKTTISAVSCLAGANEAFYRELSRNLFRVYLRKGSTIIFRDQVQEFIYFIHKGSCLVRDYSKYLYKGSMIGDIRRRGIMAHTISAETHVDLLRIKSTIFFLIMNNFFETKMAFEYEVRNFRDYVESVYLDYSEDFKENIVSIPKSHSLAESEFEPLKFERSLKTITRYRKTNWKLKIKKLINPQSTEATFFRCLFFINSAATILIIPFIIGLKALSKAAWIVLYSLDAIWVLKIIITMRTARLNKKTGNFITSSKLIFQNYFYRVDGIVVDILSVLPLELIFIVLRFFLFDDYCLHILMCLALRLLRFIHFYTQIEKQRKKLSTNFILRWITIVSSKLILLHFLSNFNLFIAIDPKMVVPQCNWDFTFDRDFIEPLLWSYLFILSSFIGGGVFECMVNNYRQTIFAIAVSFWAFVINTLFVNQVLTIIYVTHHSKSDQMHKLQQLQRYLTVRDISPPLLGKIRRYFCDVMEDHKEGPMPSFLKNSPDHIKLEIMNDLYHSHIVRCFLFNDIAEAFAVQLTARLERYIYYPGDYVTEKGDVDQNMYFIHKGEIYCIEYDEEYPALEKVVDVFVEDECFGELQGVSINVPHFYTFRARTVSDILVLSFKNWEDLRAAFPDVTQRIYSKIIRGYSSSSHRHKGSFKVRREQFI